MGCCCNPVGTPPRKTTQVIANEDLLKDLIAQATIDNEENLLEYSRKLLVLQAEVLRRMNTSHSTMIGSLTAQGVTVIRLLDGDGVTIASMKPAWSPEIVVCVYATPAKVE